MNCPKCGHPQEERLDCIRCGIVFSKYSELHFGEKPPRPEPPPPPPRTAYPCPDDLSAAEVAELRQIMRQWNRRFSEVEFERQDRNQLWKELRSLDQKTRESLSQTMQRLNEYDERISNLPEPPPELPLDVLKEQLWEEDLQPILERMERMETSLERLAKEQPPRTDPRFAEMAARIEARISEVERGLDKAEVAGSANPVAATVDNVAQEVAELRTAVQSVTVRYSEIGELKKNALAARNELEGLRRDLDALRKQPTDGAAAKLHEFQTELLALRAEVRQSLKQLAALESDRSVPSPDPALQQAVDAGNERLASLADQVRTLAADTARIDQACHALDESSARLVTELGKTLSALQMQTAETCARVSSVERELHSGDGQGDTRELLEKDVHSIRDNLDQIREFVTTLAQKL